MTILDHPFEKKKFADVAERGQNSCAVCQKRPDVHPPHPDIPRDIEDERAIKRTAAGLVTYLHGYHDLFSLAEKRALDGPVRNADLRDNFQEIAEELSDGINYATWEIQRLRRLGREEEIMLWNAVIIKTCELWIVLQEARRDD